MRSFRRSALSILVVGAAGWCLAIVAAPMISWPQIYTFFSIICHQLPNRSWHIHGQPLAVCVRCTGIYFGFLAGLFALSRPRVDWFKAAAAITAAEWLFAATILDVEGLRFLSGILLGATAAPLVRVGVEEMLSRRKLKTIHESL